MRQLRIVIAALAVSLLYAAAARAEPPLEVPLPPSVHSRGYLRVGVKCDFPPMGFITASGEHAGFEVDIAHRLAAFAFGKPDAVRFQCVSVANRIGFITTHRLDLVIATATYTKARAEVVDFSQPYFAAAGVLLVKKDAPIHNLSDLAGKTIITITGTPYVPWSQKCFPQDRLLPYEGISDALAALVTGRGDAVIEDNDLLVGLAAKYPRLRMTGEPILPGPYGIIIAKDNEPLLQWVNAAFSEMQQEDEFWNLFKSVVTSPGEQVVFASAMPRPGRNLVYSASSSELVCPK